MHGIFKRASNLFALPPEALGEFRLELIGDGELYLENHKGIAAYSESEVLLNCGEKLLKISGRRLNLCAMSESEILLRGEISQITVSEAK